MSAFDSAIESQSSGVWGRLVAVAGLLTMSCSLLAQTPAQAGPPTASNSAAVAAAQAASAALTSKGIADAALAKAKEDGEKVAMAAAEAASAAKASPNNQEAKSKAENLTAESNMAKMRFDIAGLKAAAAASEVRLTAEAAAAAAKPPAKPDSVYDITCVRVVEANFFQTLNFWKEATPTSSPKDKAIYKPPCDSMNRGGSSLVGSGNVVVAVLDSEYKKALQANANTTDPFPALFINGFFLGESGTLVSTQKANEGLTKAQLDAKAANPTAPVLENPDALIWLTFQVEAGKESKELWTYHYLEHGLVGAGSLRASVGWKGKPVFSEPVPPGGRNTLQISDALSCTVAFFLGVLMVFFFVWGLKRTDTFRDSSAPFLYWRQAIALKASAKGFVGIFRGSTAARANWDVKALKAIAAYPAYADAVAASKNDKTYPNRFRDAADLVLAGGVPDNPNDAVIGLALKEERWSPVRATYSLARVQIGMWTIFAATAAVFLWVVFGDFPVLQGSILALVTISAIGASASMLTDATNPPPLQVSEGFIKDLATDRQGKQQVHRFQAIVVNLLLLSVGIAYVIQHLAYPEFDTSWLQFLGLSAIAQVAGKQIEKKT